MTYREETKTKCPACQRSIAAVRNLETRELLVSRHLYQEGIDTTEIGYPVLNAQGFCPGSFNPVKLENEGGSQNRHTKSETRG